MRAVPEYQQNKDRAKERFIRRLIAMGFLAGQIRAILTRREELHLALSEYQYSRETGEK